jgi:hypothetical protein
MTYLSRYCTGCSEERLFEQFHAGPASCPDVPDGDCQEWACAVCGDALILGLPLCEQATRRSSTSQAALSGRDRFPAPPSPKLVRQNSMEHWCFGVNPDGAARETG